MNANRVLSLTALICTHLTFTASGQVVTEMKKVQKQKKINLDSAGWKSTGFIMLNANQAAQSGWGSGGESFQLGINFIFNKDIHHKKGKYSLDSYIDIEVGLMQSSTVKRFRKTSDRLDLTVEFDHSIGNGKHFNYGLLGNINTQLFPGHDYILDGHPKTTSFLTPGKMLLSFGVDFKDSNSAHYFSVFASPATIRWVLKRDQDFYGDRKFGVDSARRVYTEIGAYLSLHYSKHISSTVNYIGRLDLFSNYKRNPGKVDLFMNNLLTFNFSKKFAGSILLDLLYDADIRDRVQLQEITGIGLRLSW